MVEKPYDWSNGAVLVDHSRAKHTILRQYIFDYLKVRCAIPQQTRFRIAIVDGFAGAGRYGDGSPGSPLIFVEELRRASEAINLKRSIDGLGPVEISCLLLLNDLDPKAVEMLRAAIQPLLAGVTAEVPLLTIETRFFNEAFEDAYPEIRDILLKGRLRNVLFNLDQCGHSHVRNATLQDIMASFRGAEIFYTIMIESLISFLHKRDPDRLIKQLAPFGLDGADVERLLPMMGRKEWLGTGERMVFETFRTCAPYVSPFSINNPAGWRCWLIHFANSYRARQVYNDVLHDNANMQAHFGRSGLEMLSYDPEKGGELYLFDDKGRKSAHGQLVDDIPRLILETGDAMQVEEFYENFYNLTPAHADDIHRAMIDSADIEILTPSGGQRRRPNAISGGDIIKVKPQRTFFQFFGAPRDKGGPSSTGK